MVDIKVNEDEVILRISNSFTRKKTILKYIIALLLSYFLYTLFTLYNKLTIFMFFDSIITMPRLRLIALIELIQKVQSQSLEK